jgi:hypothetical protein
MKNLGKCIMTIFIIAGMFLLVTQQTEIIRWDSFVSSNKETMCANDPNPYVMTNVSVDNNGNTIIKTIDSNGFVDLAENTRSMNYKSSSTSANANTIPNINVTQSPGYTVVG